MIGYSSMNSCMFPTFTVFLVTSLLAHASSFQTRSKVRPPTHYFILGDKFAGVQFLQNHLNNTSPPLPLQECKAIDARTGSILRNQETELSWRYGFFTTNDLKKKLDCDLDQTLFILAVKDVRSMMCSVAKRKFQASMKKLQSMHLNALVVHRYEDNDHLELNGSMPLPKYKVYNYLTLRKHKLQSHYSLLTRMKHGVVSRYEDLLQDPNTHLKNILRGRGITVGAIDVTSVRQHELYNHEEKECFNIFTPTLYSKTIRKLNTRLEKKIGYNHIVNKTKQIEEQCVSLYIWNFFMDLLWWIIVPTMVFLFSFAFYLSIAGASKRYHQSRQRSKQKTCYISADKGLKKD